ncbi:hypothetical protein AYY19_19220 [Photobacterium aquimaris]|uniref:Uncharacterized protein n=1 Tax=Photobacterium aquimaris TaxID=512643 RepID=A0A2T3IER9_9GAMM|nr:MULTISPECIES: hypothetical protein [Photobacterium]OBU14460.1 hypothetical protein AYY19_19220 [Photobacterium aquimaris]OBU23496.1 hypothetical protein AYY20_01360 [Photobacterium aquimaris]PSU23304.1 hypothetical protein CTM88_19920 [Photobacterium aquimaris]PSW01961.1 hypothetical protein CTM91_06705 [Photobacterium aquimaris]
MTFIKNVLSMLTNNKQSEVKFIEYTWNEVLTMSPETDIVIKWNYESSDAAPELRTAGEVQAMVKEYNDNQQYGYQSFATCYHKDTMSLLLQ